MGATSPGPAAATAASRTAGHGRTCWLGIGHREDGNFTDRILGLALRAKRFLILSLHRRRKMIKSFAAVFAFKFVYWHDSIPHIGRSISAGHTH